MNKKTVSSGVMPSLQETVGKFFSSLVPVLPSDGKPDVYVDMKPGAVKTGASIAAAAVGGTLGFLAVELVSSLAKTSLSYMSQKSEPRLSPLAALLLMMTVCGTEGADAQPIEGSECDATFKDVLDRGLSSVAKAFEKDQKALEHNVRLGLQDAKQAIERNTRPHCVNGGGNLYGMAIDIRDAFSRLFGCRNVESSAALQALQAQVQQEVANPNCTISFLESLQTCVKDGGPKVDCLRNGLADLDYLGESYNQVTSSPVCQSRQPNCFAMLTGLCNQFNMVLSSMVNTCLPDYYDVSTKAANATLAQQAEKLPNAELCCPPSVSVSTGKVVVVALSLAYGVKRWLAGRHQRPR